MAERLSFAIWWHIRVECQLEMFDIRRCRWWTAPVRWLGRLLYKTRRFFQGARSVKRVAYEGTAGSIYDEELELDVCFSGACPVQGDGTIGGHACYYRSRGEGWQFHVAGPSGDVFADDSWKYSERPYFFPDGGWVAVETSRACILRAARRYASEARDA